MRHEHEGIAVHHIFPWPGPLFVKRGDGRVARVSRELWDGFCAEDGEGVFHEQMGDEWRTWWCVPAPEWKPVDTPGKVP